MLVLLGFAVLAGAGTAVSPCVLPVLPALLSAGATGGRRRPFGIALGLAVTFTVTIVGLATVVDGVGLGSDLLRGLAIAVLLAFGVALLVPRLAQWLERPLAALSRLGPRHAGDGFWSGVLVGGALGFVYAPCAGPILAAVVTVSAASGRTVAVAIAYAAGSAAVLLLLALGGRKVMDRVRAAGRGLVVQRVLGAVLIATGLAMAAGADVDLEGAIARHAPDLSLTAGLEDSHAVRSRLEELRGKARFDAGERRTAAGSGLPDLGPAPEFVGTQTWFNTPGGKRLTLAQLRGKVVLVDFWTYSCINCLRTLPYLRSWDAQYRKDGLVIVGVHSPEFAFEHDAGNVRDAIEANGIRYPVAQDNDLATWHAWGNQYWPAEYLIDARGHVRATHFGEGDYSDSEANIRALLAEAGRTTPVAYAKQHGVVTPSSETTAETYLGTERAQGWQALHGGTHDYGRPTGDLAPNAFRYGGEWTVGAESATAGRDATIEAEVQAARVYLVLGRDRGSSGEVQVLVDGRLTRTVAVRGHRLYELARFPADGRHRVTLRVAPGVTGYAFTFG
jgi:cytochrome c biogenesis protein CcdA/thiol-disulfide isomerase/thioredoxin